MNPPSSTPLSDSERAFYDKIEVFCKTEVAPFCDQWDKEEALPRDIFSKAGKLGLMGLVIPREFGGSELRYMAYVQVIQLIAQHCAALALDIAAHNALCVGHIHQFASPDQKKRVLPRLVNGEWVGAWALTEPNAGSDTGGLETTATPQGNAWEINGRKKFITSGGRSDILVVMAASGTTDKGRKEISAFLVEKKHVRHVRKIHTYGVKASDTSELEFTHVPAELLGERGHGQENALAILDRGRIGVAAFSLGIAKAAFQAACHYAKERKQFGRPIADFEAIQWMLADSSTEMEAAELLISRVAHLQDLGQKTNKESAMAKLYASEMATRVCNRAMQIHGGTGYSRDLPIERHLRDAKIGEIAEGTSEVQRLVIARNILKEAS